MIKLTYNEWEKKYDPILNGEYEEELLLNTLGEDYEKAALANKELKCWTLVESETSLYIIEGLRVINAINYIITKNPYVKGELFEIEFN